MRPQYELVVKDLMEGFLNWRMWGRLGWQEIKRRYRRTTLGPFWTTFSLGIFIATLGVLWAQLWKQDPKAYLPYLTSGMLAWTFVSAVITEGCAVFTAGESIIKSMRCTYTTLTCTIVWRNIIVFFHNAIIFVVVAIYAHVPVNWSLVLLVLGLLLVSLNGVWIATLLGVLCARFRDISQIVTSILQVSMFVTPIFWAPNQLGSRFIKLVDFNILYHYVDIIRAPLLGHAPAMWSYVMVTISTIVGWAITLMLFSRFRRRIPYWL